MERNQKGKKEKSEIKNKDWRKVKKVQMTVGFKKEAYLLSHLWTFPVWPLSFLQILHGFPPLK